MERYSVTIETMGGIGMSLYERHYHNDPAFPIIFHHDKEDPFKSGFWMHWHESLELLYFVNGTALVTIDQTQYTAKSGEIIVVNSNSLHAIPEISVDCQYHCLIIDHELSSDLNIHIEGIQLRELTSDPIITGLFDKIVMEFEYQSIYYKGMIKAYTEQMLVELCRYNTISGSMLPENSSRINFVKAAIAYIRHKYRETLTIEGICEEVGVSKYYFCRIFKEITGHTVVDYINFLRCEHALKLLQSGRYNVGESAVKSGFNNMSYFSKTFKRYMGKTPSEAVEEGKQGILLAFGSVGSGSPGD